jgi:hypothetical protein
MNSIFGWLFLNVEMQTLQYDPFTVASKPIFSFPRFPHLNDKHETTEKVNKCGEEEMTTTCFHGNPL